jgi:hypothetical protein
VTLRWILVLVLAQLGNLGLMEAQPKGQERWVARFCPICGSVRPGRSRSRVVFQT